MNKDEEVDKIIDAITNMTLQEFNDWLALMEDECVNPSVVINDFEHFVLFYTDDGVSLCVYHMVGYHEVPGVSDIIALKEELRTNESLGMTALVNFCRIKIVDKELAINIMEEGYSSWT